MRTEVSDAAHMNTGEGLSGVCLSFFQVKPSVEKKLIGSLSPCPTARLGLSPAASLIPTQLCASHRSSCSFFPGQGAEPAMGPHYKRDT